ncbi:MAG: outer membrane beta-barrel protein [Candidatus Eisenbacteria bacterium]
MMNARVDARPARSRWWITGAGALLTQPATRAQAGDERGFAHGLRYESDILAAQDPAPGSPATDLFLGEVGAGAGITVDYEMSERLLLRLAIGGAVHHTTLTDVEATRGTGTIEGHYRFRAGHQARPYLFMGLGGSGLTVKVNDADITTTGPVAVLGAGLETELSSALAFDIAVRLDRINYNRVETREAGVTLRAPVNQGEGAAKVTAGFRWQL